MQTAETTPCVNEPTAANQTQTRGAEREIVRVEAGGSRCSSAETDEGSGEALPEVVRQKSSAAWL